MNYIFDIVSRFVPIGLSSSQIDIFIGVGSVVFLGFLAYLFYRIARIFI